MAVKDRPLAHIFVRSQRVTQALTGVAYALALLALVVLARQGLDWLQLRIDDLRYGVPRRAHVSGVVGPEPLATEFIALNLNGQISVVIIPGSDIHRLIVLPGPYLVGRDSPSVVPLPSLRDANDDGQLDLLVTIRGEVIVYVNKQGVFQHPTAEERAGLTLDGVPP